MKNNKTSKILVLAISVLLLVGCFVGVNVSAEDSAAPQVEILFNNLEYGDNISILYAAKVSGAESAEIRMDFYTEADGVYNLAYSDTSYNVEDITVNDVTESCLVFNSDGIAPKHMTEIVFAQLVVTIDGTEYKSNMSRFSIAEYCYKRLYKDTNATEDQKALYNHVLGYGTYAQKVLNYNTTDTPADYRYVNAEGAVVDSVEIADNTYNFSAGIFKAGEILTLKHNSLDVGEAATWNVVYTDANGAVTNESLSDNATVTVEDKHIVAVPSVEIITIDFEDFDASSATYDKDVLVKADEKITTTVKDTTEENGAYKYVDVDVVADPSDAENNALYIYGKYPGANPTSSTKVDLMAGAEGNLYVFSADINIAASGTAGNIATLNFGNASNSRIYALSLQTPKSNGVQTSGLFSSNTVGPYSYKSFGSYMPFNEWFNLRVEIYYNGTSYVDEASGTTLYYTAKYYVNGYFIGDDLSYNSSAQNIDFMSLDVSAQNQKIYLDNITFVRTNGTFTAGTPADSKPIPVPQAGALTNGSGAFYSNANETGNRYDFNSDYGYGGAAVTTRPYDANAYLSYDGYVFYEKVNTTNSSSHTGIRFDSSANTYENAYYVIEFDAAFNSDKSSFFVVTAKGSGEENSVFMSATADGKITFANQISQSTVLNGFTYNPALESATLECGKWYNLRFEFYKGGVTSGDKNVALVKVFVDGVEYASLVGVDYRTSSDNYSMLSLRAADNDAWVCFDNLYVGFKEITTAE